MLLFVWFTMLWERVHPELEPTRKGGVIKNKWEKVNSFKTWKAILRNIKHDFLDNEFKVIQLLCLFKF